MTASPPPLDLAGADGQPRTLTLEDVVGVARRGRDVVLLREDAKAYRPLEEAMAASAAWVHAEVHGKRPGPPKAVYGINTGFGSLAGRQAFTTPYHARVLSRNLLVSHSAGQGDPLPEDVVRASLLIRAHQLVQGRSGIRIPVVNRYLAMLNAGVYPIVPESGSLGASGDLAPLSHLALTVSRPPEPPADGEPLPLDRRDTDVWVTQAGRDSEVDHTTSDFITGRTRRWRRIPAAQALEPLGGQLVLEAKEGLALNNGATVSTALLALTVADGQRILEHAEIAVALTLEAIRGFRDAFLPEVHAARPHPGAIASAERILALVAGSTLIDPASRETNPQRVPPQDPYSVRCAPQVIGAGRESLDCAARTLAIELNAAVDNPLIFVDLPRAYKTLSCGNFHGAPIGYALDALKVILTDCASQSERRTFKLTDYRFDDPVRKHLSLPSFLVTGEAPLEGLNSGLMIPQYTAAALVSACKTLAHPDSVDSIPSSANQEDHVSMSHNAGLHARQIARNTEAVVAVELLTAAQALEFRKGDGRLGQGTQAAYDAIRRRVSALTHDRVLSEDMDTVVRMMRTGEILDAIKGQPA